MQHFLKRPPGAAWAWIVPPELFQQFLFAVNKTMPSLDLRFGREALSAFTYDLESKRVHLDIWVS